MLTRLPDPGNRGADSGWAAPGRRKNPEPYGNYVEKHHRTDLKDVEKHMFHHLFVCAVLCFTDKSSSCSQINKL